MLTTTFIDVNGVRLRVIDAGPDDGPVVVLAHGFPELAFSWRHQIPALAQAGYRVLAPDQRGYGGSSRPEQVEAYDIAALTGDLVGLIDAVGAERAAIVGHDWGATVAWSVPLLHPDRVVAVAGFGDNFFYVLYFQQPGVADTELAADPRESMLRMLGGMRRPADEASATRMASRMLAPGPQGFVERLVEPERLPHWLTETELDYYAAEFSRTGFTGALNWYRNFDRNWEIMAHPVADTILVPGLFVGGTDDPVLAFTRTDRAGEVAKGPYRQVMLDGAGHWIQQERADQVNTELLSFLSESRWK